MSSYMTKARKRNNDLKPIAEDEVLSLVLPFRNGLEGLIFEKACPPLFYLPSSIFCGTNHAPSVGFFNL